MITDITWNILPLLSILIINTNGINVAKAKGSRVNCLLEFLLLIRLRTSITVPINSWRFNAYSLNTSLCLYLTTRAFTLRCALFAF